MGSLTKAGKVRDRSEPIHWREGKRSKKGMPFKGKKSKIPRVRNRRNFEKRIILGKPASQTQERLKKKRRRR